MSDVVISARWRATPRVRDFSGHFLRPRRLLAVSRVLLVLVVLASPRAFAGGDCVVRGSSVTLQDVTVQPPRDDAFQLGVREVPASATLPAKCGAPLALDVAGDLVFKASRDQVWLSLTRDVTSADGLVTAMKGAHVIDACVRGAKVFGNLVAYSDDVLEGEHKPASEWIKEIELPCDALTLDTVAMTADDML